MVSVTTRSPPGSTVRRTEPDPEVDSSKVTVVSGSCSAAMGTELMKPFFVHFGAAVPTGTAAPGRSRPSGVLGTVRVTATTSARSLLPAVLVVALVGGTVALLTVGDGLGAGRLVLDHLDRGRGQLGTVDEPGESHAGL